MSPASAAQVPEFTTVKYSFSLFSVLPPGDGEVCREWTSVWLTVLEPGESASMGLASDRTCLLHTGETQHFT